MPWDHTDAAVYRPWEHRADTGFLRDAGVLVGGVYVSNVPSEESFMVDLEQARREAVLEPRSAR